jgi:hypothetical protein
MRTTILTSTVAACVAALVLVPVTANAAPATGLKIDHSTGTFYQYDPSIEGTGPTYDAVVVKAQLRNCPAGYHRYWMTLTQDGVSYDVASTALGTGELICSGSAKTTLRLGFYGNGLHPGLAQATVTVYWETAGMPELLEVSGTVRIPTGTNNPS